MPKNPPAKYSIICFAAAIFILSTAIVGQPQFRIGERITYSVSLDRFPDVAFAEIYTVSRGAFAGADAIELRGKLKMLNFARAVSQVDEVRTVFVDPVSGMPLQAIRVQNPDGISTETTTNYQQAPLVNFDLVSLIYKIRHSGGSGEASFQEGERVYGVTFQPIGAEKVRVTAGDFDTTVISVQSEYFTDLGFKYVKVFLSNDEARVPVVIRFMTDKKSGFRVEAASIQSIVPEPAAVPTISPTPVPRISPMPSRTPEPYTANAPLAPELAFAIGETLEYRLTAGGRAVGTFVLRARERVQVMAKDSLILTAMVTNSSPGNPVFAVNDSIVVNVDPITLAPRQMDIRMTGPLAFLTQSVSFNERTGAISYKGNNRVDAPIATHSILSLIYAMRSFNLKPSPIRDNPVNDTRVAVFWESQPYVFTLRPRPFEEISINGEKRQAQQIAINTGNPQLDQLALKVWLSANGGRVPLRFAAGPYQADLVSQTNVAPLQ